MNLVIDVGNTQFKICVFSGNEIIHSSYSDELKGDVICELLKSFAIKQCIFSSTRNIEKQEIEDLLPSSIKVMGLDNKTKLPISVDYDTPNTLGKDRLAAAVGGKVVFANHPVLIVDVGTAITIDLIDEKDVFKGGVISPGPAIRFRSLNEYTGKLPLIKASEQEIGLTGKSTHDAILFGVQNGILFEINEYILRYKQQYQDLKVILTGGYAYLFDKKINYPIFAELFLVPIGLNRILDYNDN